MHNTNYFLFPTYNLLLATHYFPLTTSHLLQRNSCQIGLPARYRFQLRLTAAETRQPPGALAFNQCAQALPHQAVLLRHTRNSLGFIQQLVINIQGCAHGNTAFRNYSHQNIHYMMTIVCL